MDSHPPLSAALRTPLCDLLDIRYPIVLAAMAGGPTTPELVAAVSQAGGLGLFAGTGLAPDVLRAAIRAIKGRTDRPFGVNFQLAIREAGNQDVPRTQAFLDRFRLELRLPPGRTDLTPPPNLLAEQLAVVCAERVPVLSVALGDPTSLVESAHAAGARVMAMVSTVDEALRVAAAGVDIVVAQGAEAGGHRTTFEIGPDGDVPLIGTLALVPQVVDSVRVPVLAAGGIMDGRGLVASLALGAAGVLLGTRFLTARESGAAPAYQARLLAATEADTVITRAFTGRPARSVRNRFITESARAGAEPLAWPLQRRAADDIYQAGRACGDADYFPLLAGQGLRLLKRGQGAAEIVAELVTEATAVLSRLGGASP